MSEYVFVCIMCVDLHYSRIFLHCNVLCCCVSVLGCVVLRCAALGCVVLCRVVSCCVVLYYYFLYRAARERGVR